MSHTRRAVDRLELPDRRELVQLRRRVDDAVQKSRPLLIAQGTPITCGGAGCSACCRGDVEVSAREAQAILARAPERAFRRALALADRIEDEDARRRVPCPLLDAGGLCSVYLERPLSCRLYQVTTPRDWCKTEEDGGVTRDVTRVLDNAALALTFHEAQAHGLRSLPLELLRFAEAKALTGPTEDPTSAT